MKKIFDLYNKSEIDLLICKSKSHLTIYEKTINSIEKFIVESGIPSYCVKSAF